MCLYYARLPAYLVLPLFSILPQPIFWTELSRSTTSCRSTSTSNNGCHTRSPSNTCSCHCYYDDRDALTRFHSRSPPTISVLDYLKRIVRYIPRIEVGIPLLPSRLPRLARSLHPSLKLTHVSLSAPSFCSSSITLTGSVLVFNFLPFPLSPSIGSSLRVSPLPRKPSATPLPPIPNSPALVGSASLNSTSLRRNFLPSLIGAWL